MKIVVLGPAHPYRGGLASIMETLARLFQRRGNEVSIETFTVQYPRLLFPGKSQTVDTPAPPDLRITRSVDTVNPLNWLKIGRKIRRERPDMLLLKYWTPFMAPCFGTISRLARRNKVTKTLCQIDNVEPHEHHWFDRPLNRYFLRSVDGFIYMSEQVHNELKAYTDAPALFSPHPLFEHFGEPVPREEACRNLGLDPNVHYALFFGLVRDYKGLDLLLDAWKLYKEKFSILHSQLTSLRSSSSSSLGRDCEQSLPSLLRRSSIQLIVAGEFYTSREKYLDQIARNGLASDVILHDRFIPDTEVKQYFSAADFLVQPYKTATQSGVTQIAYHFDLPMIVTDVGGLAEIVPDGKTGLVVAPDPPSIARAIGQIPALLAEFRSHMSEEKKRFSWEAMCDRLTELYALTHRPRE